ncbi:MAG: GTP-binding protein, partial [Bacteroidota bacterium]
WDWGIENNQKNDTGRGQNFLDEASKNTIRVKGYIQINDKTLAVQSSFGNTEIREVSQYQGPTELIFIGEGVNISDINNIFRKNQTRINNGEKNSFKSS